jgi:hypothetical protein
MDDFLNQYQKNPSQEFSKKLYQRINQPEPQPKSPLALRVGLAVVGIAFVGVAIFTVPVVTEAAQNFLNLFRVKQVTAIAIDPARMEALNNIMKDRRLDIKALVGDDVKIIKEPGKPSTPADPAQASAMVGYQVKGVNPASGFNLDGIRVQNDGASEIKANSAKLNSMLSILGITDIKAPAKLDGGVINVTMPNVVVSRYSSARGALTLTQAKSPEITLPDGVTMAELGEIGLRVTGMSPADAKRMAASIDWTSTLVVPVPTNVASFRDVIIRGNKGILVTSGGMGATPVRTNNAPRAGSVAIWSENGIVYALEAALPPDDVMALTNALQ